MEQAELAVVDHLVFLAFAQGLDGQSQLLLELVHRLVVEVGDAGVDPQHGLGDAQFVLARRELVVDEGAGQRGLAGVSGGHGDVGLAAAVRRAGGPGREVRDMGAQRLRAVRQLPERLQGEGQHGAAGDGAHGEGPGRVRLQGHALAEVVAVGQGAERGLVAVLAGAGLGELAVGDEEDLVRGPALFDERVAGRVLPLDEGVRERLEHVAVLEAAQQRQLAQLGRDDADVGAGGDELDAAVADRVRQPPVDPVGAGRDLHPGQDAQQPAGGDPAHLRYGLGGRRELACRVGAQAQLCGGRLLGAVRLR